MSPLTSASTVHMIVGMCVLWFGRWHPTITAWDKIMSVKGWYVSSADTTKMCAVCFWWYSDDKYLFLPLPVQNFYNSCKPYNSQYQQSQECLDLPIPQGYPWPVQCCPLCQVCLRWLGDPTACLLQTMSHNILWYQVMTSFHRQI
jgi:hypothetical protein